MIFSSGGTELVGRALAMIGRTEVVFDEEAHDVPALSSALFRAAQLFENAGQHPPPLPQHLAIHVPCQLLVTKHISKTHRITGRIQLLRLDVGVNYEDEWTI
jgi:hypothetical protein